MIPPQPVRAASSPQSRTLDKGLWLLDILAAHPAGLGIGELSAAVGTQRGAVSRLLGTLRAHGLVTQTPDGRHHVGPGLLTLAAPVHAELRRAARPHLRKLAQALGVTAFLAVRDGDHAVCVCVGEPDDITPLVAYDVGVRHRLTIGASGLAILAGQPAKRRERAEVTAGRQRGYLVTRGELQAHGWCLATALRGSRWRLEASVGVIAVAALDEPATAVAVNATARTISDAAPAG